MNNYNDTWKWLINLDGKFSVSSLGGLWESNVCTSLAYKHFWNKSVPIKINFFEWRFVLNRLPSKIDLEKRGVRMDSMLCESCGLEVESSIHILLDCRWVKEIWLLIQTWCDVNVTHATSIEDFLSRKCNYFQVASHQKVLHAIFLTALPYKEYKEQGII